MPRARKKLKKVDDEDEAPGSEEEDLFDSDAEDDKAKKKKAKKKAKKKKSKKADSEEEEGAAESDSDASPAASPADDSDDDDKPLAAKSKRGAAAAAADSSDDDQPLAGKSAGVVDLGPRPDWGDKHQGKTPQERRDFQKLTQVEQESVIFDRTETIRAWDERQRAIEAADRQRQAAEEAKRAATDKKSGRRTSSAAAAAAKETSASAKKKAEREDLKKRKQQKFVSEDGEATDDEEEPAADEEYDSDAKPKKRKRKADSDDDRAMSGADDDTKDMVGSKKSASSSSAGEVHTSKITLDDLNGLQLKRQALEKLVEEPFFAEFVPQKFVRMNIGTKGDGTAVYRICEVIKVVDDGSKPYAINPDPKLAGKKTSKRLEVQCGDAKKAFPMSLVSNQRFTQAEMDKWLDVLKNAKGGPIPPPTAQEAVARKKAAKQLQENFVYTPAMVANMLKLKKVRNFSIEMTKLKSAREDAKAKGDERAYNDLTRRIEELDEQELTQMRRKASAVSDTSSIASMSDTGAATGDTSVAKQKASVALSGGGGILDINRRHQMENHTQIDKANAEKVKKHEEYSSKRADPFKRRATRPAQIFSDPSALPPTTPTGKAAAKPAVAAKKEEKKTGRKRGDAALAKPEDDIIIDSADKLFSAITTPRAGTTAVPAPDSPTSSAAAASSSSGSTPHHASLIRPDASTLDKFSALKRNPIFARLAAMHSLALTLDLNAVKPKIPARVVAAAQQVAMNAVAPAEYQKTFSLPEYFKRREEGEQQS